jgi:branched-chain amino acid transport system ATP-binding protein
VAQDSAVYEKAAALLKEVGLAERAEELAPALSHGEQRVLELALALATEPKMLLLDEPMAGAGPEESQRIVELIESLRRDKHMAILLVEHDMDAVFRLADRISVLVNGTLIASGSPEEIRQDAQVRAAYLGDESPS